jgi:hypothetical protein
VQYFNIIIRQNTNLILKEKLCDPYIRGWAGANGEGVIAFCVAEKWRLPKIVQALLGGHVFLCI